MVLQLTAAEVVLFLRQYDDRAAFRRLIRQRRELRRIGQLRFRNSRRRYKARRLAIAQRDGAGLVEQQSVDIACGFHGAARHGEHIMLHQAIHARNSNGREQPANRRRNQANQQRDQHEHGLRRAGVNCKWLERDHCQQKDDRQSGEQNIQRDLIRRLLSLGAFDQSNHAIKESLAGVGSDFHLDLI